MGRKMFGPAVQQWTGWDPTWHGWWGENPPYHAPVFVLTHHEREPIEMDGGTTFHFVTDGFDAAYARAVEAKVLDEIVTDVSPMMLGGGERLFEGIADPGPTPIRQRSSGWAPRRDL